MPEGSIIKTTDGFTATITEDTLSSETITFKDPDPRWSDIEVKFSEFDDCSLEGKVEIPESASPNYNINKADTSEDWEARFDSAYSASSREEYDAKYRSQAGDVWQNSDEATKHALYEYTNATYTGINRALRDGDTGWSLQNDDIDAMTAAIDKSSLSEDTILTRGVSTRTLEKLFGLGNHTLTEGNASSIVGRTGTDDAFMSCGSTKNTGFKFKSAIISILCPKGTKALYAEPFSACGNGKGINWDERETNADGKSAQTSYSSELETIIQRGSTLQCLSGGYNSSTGKFEYRIVVAGQDYQSSEYSKKRALFT